MKKVLQKSTNDMTLHSFSNFFKNRRYVSEYTKKHAAATSMTVNPNLRLLTAVLLMLVTIALFTMMALARRYLRDELDTFK